MGLISIIISGVLAIAFIFNAIFTHLNDASKDTRNDYRDLNDKIVELRVIVSEIKIEISQARKDITNIEERQLKMEGEIDTIRRNSDDKRLQINMIEANKHFPNNIVDNKQEELA